MQVQFRLLFATLAALGGTYLLLEDPLVGQKPGEGSRSAPQATARELGRQAWVNAVARHYDPLQLDLSDSVRWGPFLIVIGHYEGTLEPCGCVSGQAGGIAWESFARKELGAALGTKSVSLLLGGNSTPPESVVPDRLSMAVRELALACVEKYAMLTKVDMLCRSVADEAFSSATSGEHVREVSSSPIPVRVLSWDLSHAPPTSATAIGRELRILAIHGTKRAGARELLSDALSKAAPESRWIVVDVEGGLGVATVRGHPVLPWGSVRGTSIGVLRLAFANAPVSDSGGGKLIDLGPIRREFVSGVRREPLVAADGAVFFDWWRPTVAHVGVPDEHVLAALEEFRKGREALFLGGDSKGLSSPFDSLSCAKCHQAHQDAGGLDRHAHACETLRDRGQAADPTCLRCHSTAFRSGATGGFEKGVTCSSCHEGTQGLRAEKHGPLKKTTSETCTQCHTSTASPEFEYEPFRSRLGCIRCLSPLQDK